MDQTVEHAGRLGRAGAARLFTVLLLLAVELALLFGGAGTLQWRAAWGYAGLRLAGTVAGGVFILWVNPQIISERGRKPQETRPFDRVFMAVYAPLSLLLPLLIGLDYRYAWSAVAPPWRGLGLLLLIIGMALPYAAMAANAYLTTNVRIQEERGHRVVSSGPYRFMRHPMYTGMALMNLGAALALGSWWGLLLAGLAATALVWRTAREDAVLQAELPGYAAYAARVPYRLLPGIW